MTIQGVSDYSAYRNVEGNCIFPLMEIVIKICVLALTKNSNKILIYE